MDINPRASWTSSPIRATALQATHSGFGVHWEGPRMGPYSAASVPVILRGIEDYHRRNGWSDLAYNFVVDRYGRIWEGRGWGIRNGANGYSTANYGNRATCYLGGEGDGFTAEAEDALIWLYHEHLARGGLAEAIPHRGFTATACPGDDISSFVLYVLPHTVRPGSTPTGPSTSRRRKAFSDMRSTLRPGSGPGRYISDIAVPEVGDRVIVRKVNLNASGSVSLTVHWGNGALTWNGHLGDRGDGTPFDPTFGYVHIIDRLTAPATGICSVIASDEVVLDLDPQA